MKSTFVLFGLAFAMLTPIAAQAAQAAGTPSIAITSPANGAKVTGGTVTMSVSVSHFKVVKPVLKNPPVLKGYAGNIEYIFESSSTALPVRVLSGSLNHTWNNIPPGRHMLVAELVTNQHVPWPGGKPATISIVVPAPPKPAHRTGGATAPGVGAAPTTGGAADVSRSPLNLSLLLAGVLALLVGLAFLTRRFAFGGASEGSGDATEATMRFESFPGAEGREGSSEAGEVESEDQSLPAAMAARQEAMSDVFPASEPEEALALEEPIAEEEAAPVVAQPEPIAEQMVAASPSSAVRDQAIEMARQWSAVVEGLVRQIDEQEAERRRMLEHIRVLEDHLRGGQGLREQVRGLSLSAEDFQAVRYVTESLQRDPDHIVVLASVAQHAGQLQRLVESYARLREAVEKA